MLNCSKGQGIRQYSLQGKKRMPCLGVLSRSNSRRKSCLGEEEQSRLGGGAKTVVGVLGFLWKDFRKTVGLFSSSNSNCAEQNSLCYCVHLAMAAEKAGRDFARKGTSTPLVELFMTMRHSADVPLTTGCEQGANFSLSILAA